MRLAANARGGARAGPDPAVRRRHRGRDAARAWTASPLLDELKKLDEDLPVIMITAFASVENAIAAMKRGAFDYITKPFKNDEVLVVVAQRARAAPPGGREPRPAAEPPGALRTSSRTSSARSPRMRQVFDLIIQAAPSRIDDPRDQGESGTGKELVARAIHANSAARRPAVRHGQLRQPAAGPARVEPVRPRASGAFTGAVYPKKGLFELADKGTHLLRRDRQRAARDAGQAAARHPGAGVHAPGRRGDDQGRRPDHRRDQRRPAAHDGGGPVPRGPVLPAARHHRCTCRRCASARTTSRCWCSTSWRSTAARTTRPDLELTPEALDLLTDYDWPGNVRELENVIERAVVLTSGSRIEREPGPRPRPADPRLPAAAVRACRPRGSRSRT